jgi:predicted DNA-binding transcriptional regulator AlpA
MTVHEFPDQVGKGAIVDIATIAAYVGMSTRWVRYRIADDGFPVRRLSPGKLGFRFAEVDVWMERQDKKNQAPARKAPRAVREPNGGVETVEKAARRIAASYPRACQAVGAGTTLEGARILARCVLSDEPDGEPRETRREVPAAGKYEALRDEGMI